MKEQYKKYEVRFNMLKNTKTYLLKVILILTCLLKQVPGFKLMCYVTGISSTSMLQFESVFLYQVDLQREIGLLSS